MTGRVGTVSGCPSKLQSMDSPEPVSGAGPAFQSPGEEGRTVSALASWPHVSFLELAALPTAVPCGRLHTRQVVWEWSFSHLADDAELVVSELLSNAVKASWSPNGSGLIALRLLADHEQLLIEVWDHNPADPESRQLDDSSESGRGFIVVEAIAKSWGFQRFSPTLKVVWAELLATAGLDGR